ncbi:hypothetical protein Tco_1532539 [Tanacetum coccineum]
MQYDVAAIYGYISIGAFPKTTLFYIDRHTSEVIARLYGPIMRILSVVRIEVFPMYGYNYMKKIVLRRADLKEYVIAERDFKYLYPIDFEIFYLSESLRSLKSSLTRDKKIITTAVNYGQEKLMIMRFNEIHKFSDGTLHQIDEALDLQDSRNLGSLEVPGLDTRCWTKIDCRQCRVAWSLCLPFRNELMTRRILRFAVGTLKASYNGCVLFEDEIFGLLSIRVSRLVLAIIMEIKDDIGYDFVCWDWVKEERYDIIGVMWNKGIVRTEMELCWNTPYMVLVHEILWNIRVIRKYSVKFGNPARGKSNKLLVSAIASEATVDGTVSDIMGDEIGEGTIEGAGETTSEPDGHSGDVGV